MVKVKENSSDKLQKAFLEYLNTGKYINNYKSYKFIIINCVQMQEELKMLLEDIFIEPVFLYTEEDVIVIYHDDVDEREYIDIVLSLAFDSGEKLKVFKGCPVNVENNECLSIIYNVYLKYKTKEYIVSNMTDMILDLVHKDKSLLQKVKESILYKVNMDNQLVKLILGMFECDLNVTKTAGLMYMHRNTINNKIDYIKKETGFNVQNFKDAMALYILIKMV